MGYLWDTEEEDKMQELFHTGSLRFIVYREKIENIAPKGATEITLAVKIRRRTIGLMRDTYIGVAYWPNGPVIRGVQGATEGETVVFRKVLVKPGAEILVALGDEIAVEVSAEGADYAPPPVDEGSPFVPFVGLGVGLGTVALVVVGAYLLGEYLKGAGGAAVKGGS